MNLQIGRIYFFCFITIVLLTNCSHPSSVSFELSKYEVHLYSSSFILSIEHDSIYCGTLVYYISDIDPELHESDYDNKSAGEGAINLGEYENTFFFDAKYIVNFSSGYSVKPPIVYDKVIRYNDRIEYYNTNVFNEILDINRHQIFYNGLLVSRSYYLTDTLCITYDCYKHKLPDIKVEFTKVDSSLRQFIIDEYDN